MIDRNSRPAIMAVSRRDPRATVPPPWAPGHPRASRHGEQWSQRGLPPGRAAGGRPQTANTFLTMARYMARESRMPSQQGTGEPTRPRDKDGMGAALALGPPASVCVVASRHRHSLICHGLWPCDSAAFLLWGQRNLGLTEERVWGDSGGLLWGSANQ